MVRASRLVRECRVDIYEENGSVILEAELPGIDESQIQLEVDSQQVSIRARPTECGDSRRYHRQERHARSFQREIPLPVRIDRENVIAMIRDGVLLVNFGAKCEAEVEPPQAIAIRSGSTFRRRPLHLERTIEIVR